jgi:hypothetical protein
MARVTKAERDESIANLKEWLVKAGPGGSATVHIQWVSGGPTSSGRTDRYEVRLWEHAGTNYAAAGETVLTTRPQPTMWLTFHVARALGYRFNARHEAVVLTGYGYSKSHEIACSLARLVGHPIFVQAPGESMFSGGMIGTNL